MSTHNIFSWRNKENVLFLVEKKVSSSGAMLNIQTP